MLYRIGTKRELPTVASKIPERVYSELYTGTVVLDAEYGAERDCLQTGGYSLIVETADDLAAFKAVIDYENHPCEWATRLGRDSGWLSALYLLNDDYAIVAFMPMAIAPAAILNDLED